MFGFDDNVDNILGSLQIISIEEPSNPRFEEFKQYAVGYVQEHDELEPNHQVLEQIQNSSSVDQIETFLRDLDYCDECFLKMYRLFAAGEQMEGGCGGEEGIEDTSMTQDDPFASAQSACADMVNQEDQPPGGS